MPVSASHRIVTLSLVGGFLDGQVVTFAPGLNCIIGARGTGKTTVLEFIRWALDDLPPEAADRDRIAHLVTQNLRGGRVDVAVETKDGRTYTVSRREGEDPIVLDATGAPTGIVVSRGGLFRLDVFSQNAVERMADHAADQLALIDTCRADDIARLHAQIDAVRAELKASAGQIAPLQDHIAALAEQLKMLPTILEKLKACAADGGSAAPAIDAAQIAKALRGREMQAIRSAQEAVSQVGIALRDLVPVLGDRTQALIAPDMRTGPNGPLLVAVDHRLEACRTTVDQHFQAALGLLRDEHHALSAIHGQLTLAHQGQDVAFNQLLEQHKELQGKATERAKLERDRNDLLATQRQHQEAVAKLGALREHRQGLQRRLSELRDQRFAIRESVVASINAALSPTITMRLEQFGSTAAVEALLADKLAGAGVKVGTVVDKLMAGCNPTELAAIIAAGDAEALADATTLNPSQVTKVLQTLGANGAAFDLEVVDLVDLPDIQLKDVDTYKPTRTLSTGQKCTAILPILLLDSDNPLIIDQPEDNLDNRFIFDTIVESIRTVKSQRQLIFATHNPNIPVLGEADRVVVMESNGSQARMRTAGDVDHCKEDIVTLLEGGREAFVQRKNRYCY